MSDGNEQLSPDTSTGFRFMTLCGSSDLSALGPDDQLKMGPDRKDGSCFVVPAGAVLTRGGLPIINPEVTDGVHEMLDGTTVTKFMGEVIVRSDDLEGRMPEQEDLE